MLIEQFTQDVSNQRSDEYGGNIENRSRFAVEVLQAVADAVGPHRTALRLSPWSTYGGQGMEDPIPQYSDVIRKAKSLGLGYLHLIESRVKGFEDVISHNTLDFAIQLWDGVVMVNGGYNGDSARELVEKKCMDRDVAVSFGRHFIANPDLVYRLMKRLPLNAYDRSTFYSLKEPRGYIDYPFSAEYLADHGSANEGVRELIV